MKLAKKGAKSAIQHFIDGVDPKHAAIYIDAKDAGNIRKGTRIKIPAYTYSLDTPGGGSGKVVVIPIYEKLEITRP